MNERPKPFDLVLVSDVARIARDSKIVFDFIALMKTHEVPIFFVTEQIDSTHPHFDLSIEMTASANRRYSEALSRKMKTVWKNQHSSASAQKQAM